MSQPVFAVKNFLSKFFHRTPDGPFVPSSRADFQSPRTTVPSTRSNRIISPDNCVKVYFSLSAASPEPVFKVHRPGRAKTARMIGAEKWSVKGFWIPESSFAEVPGITGGGTGSFFTAVIGADVRGCPVGESLRDFHCLAGLADVEFGLDPV